MISRGLLSIGNRENNGFLDHSLRISPSLTDLGDQNRNAYQGATHIQGVSRNPPLARIQGTSSHHRDSHSTCLTCSHPELRPSHPRGRHHQPEWGHLVSSLFLSYYIYMDTIVVVFFYNKLTNHHSLLCDEVTVLSMLGMGGAMGGAMGGPVGGATPLRASASDTSISSSPGHMGGGVGGVGGGVGGVGGGGGGRPLYAQTTTHYSPTPPR